MEEKCINCKHIRRLKSLTDEGWKWSYICVLFADEKDGWALNLENETETLCECFEEKRGEI